MTITNEQIGIFINSAIIGTIIYMLIYSKKGKDKNLIGYIGALGNCFGLSIIFIFIVLGGYFIKVCLTQPLYEGLFVPIIWYILAYHLIKNILNNDFGLNIHIINPNSKTFNIMEKLKFLLLYLIFIIPFGIGSFLIFREAIINIGNTEENIFPLFIIGLIFLCFTIFLIISMCGNIFKAKLKISKHLLEKIGWGVFFSIFILVGILALNFGIQESQVYKEKVAMYKETEGIYIGYNLYSEADYDSSATYSLEYAYEVNGNMYTVFTDYGTTSIPVKGTKKTILYNPENPSEAIIEGNFSGNFATWFGVIFIIAPFIVIIPQKIGKIKDKKIKAALSYIGNILLNIGIIALGIGVYCLICSSGNDYSIGAAFKLMGLCIIIPIAFVLAGTINLSYFIYQGLKKYKNNKIQRL